MFEHIRDPAARVRALCEHGCNVTVEAAIPPKRYLRSGKEMMRNADIYRDEGHLENAFLLYSKFVTLFVEKLPAHPDYQAAPRVELKKNKSEVKRALKAAEEIKVKLLKQFGEIEAIRQKEEERIRREEEEKRKEEQRIRLEEEKRKKEEAARREAELEERLKLEQEEQLRALKAEEQARLDRLRAEQEQREAAEKTAALAAAEAAQAALHNATISDSASLPPAYGSAVPSGSTVPPPPYAPKPDVPNRNLKPTAPPSTPSVDRTTKPMDHFMSTGASSTNAYGLKTVVVPGELMIKFLNLAFSNTSQSIETFGALCGKLVPARDCYVLSHLVIPKQQGTPDSCEPYNEEDMFEIQDKYGLNFLGWIHTHPTQTAFLSSVDCHTQCNYQLLLPEMIAIVCSPKFNETGFFHLSPDYGLKFVADCTQSGFHKHPDNPPIFQECPHVQVDAAASITVIDLRSDR